MNNYIEITADKEVITQIEEFFKSDVLSNKRSIKLGKIEHWNGYSTVQILPTETTIKPEDLFWLGWYSKYIETRNKIY